MFLPPRRVKKNTHTLAKCAQKYENSRNMSAFLFSFFFKQEMNISFQPGCLQTAPVAKRVLCLNERRRYRRVHAETTRAVTPAGETLQPRQCFPTNTLTVFRQRKLHAQISDAHVLVSASHPAHVEVGFTSQSNTEQLNMLFLPGSYSKQRR